MHNPGNSSGNVYVNEPMGVGEESTPVVPTYPPNATHSFPPSVGSLGTPNIGAMWSNSPQYYNAGNQYGYPQANNNNNNAALDPNIQLVPTRPLLKALSKVSKPNPPWCVGSRAGSLKVSEELSIFSNFNTSTEEEMKIYNQCVENISRVMREVWPQASLHPKGITAAVMAPKKEICNHLYAVHCDDLEGVKQFEELAIKQGFHLEFGTDNRGLPAVICTDCVSGVKSCITYGPEAEKKCKGTSDILRDAYSSTQSARDVLFVLLALLQQNRILDDGGLNQKLFSGEALAVMLLSVVNSYENNLLPDSGRILLDFFLTFGFVAYFNPVASSVTIKTMQPHARVHMTSQLSVLDPADETINLTPSLDRVSNVQTVFSYCYSALNQYTQVSSGQRRAQSVLSTIIGGEPYWIRVFRLYEQGVDPYYTFIAEHKAALYQSQHGS